LNFVERLLSIGRRNQSLLCIGLDPDPELMPIADVFQFNKEIIDATSDLVCAYKPNLAFYEALGWRGVRALYHTVKYIAGAIPVIGDAKRGDVSHSSQAYAKALFDMMGFDAVTVNPYLGQDSLEPFLSYADRGVFILCRTTNPGALDIQTLRCFDDGGGKGLPLFEVIAQRARRWNTRGNVGLVVGATSPAELKRVRQLCPDMPLLIPGVGTQGGDLVAAVQCGVNRRGELAVINSSRQIIYASKDKDFAKAARQAAQQLRDQINAILQTGRMDSGRTETTLEPGVAP